MVEDHKKLSNVINSIQEILKNYNENVEKEFLISKSTKIESHTFTTLLTKSKFKRLLSDHVWTLNCISQVLLMLDLAIKEDHLVEITVADS